LPTLRVTRDGAAPPRMPLESTLPRRILRAVRRLPALPVRTGLVVGALTAAATAGTLVGFGLHAGTPLRPFNALARLLLGSRADAVWGFDPAVTPVGLLLHVTLMLAYGVVFTSLARTLRGWRLGGAAVAFALCALAVDALVATRLLHAGLTDVLLPSQLLALHALLAASLAVGIRLAQGRLQSD